MPETPEIHQAPDPMESGGVPEMEQKPEGVRSRLEKARAELKRGEHRAARMALENAKRLARGVRDKATRDQLYTEIGTVAAEIVAERPQAVSVRAAEIAGARADQRGQGGQAGTKPEAKQP